jgi:hypothetical protein
MDLGVRDVPAVGFGAGGGEGGVVAAPDDERGRAVLAQIGLPARIGRHIGPVVIEEVELDALLAGWG